MLSRLVNHARSNVIAYLALGCALLALAGGAYATVALPANSVGARQIRNGSVTPAKLNRRAIGGTIVHWARVNAAGRVVASSGGARELSPLNNGGNYEIAWTGVASARCTVVANVLASPPPAPPAGIAMTAVEPIHHQTVAVVNTYALNAQRAPQPFSVAVIC